MRRSLEPCHRHRQAPAIGQRHRARWIGLGGVQHHCVVERQVLTCYPRGISQRLHQRALAALPGAIDQYDRRIKQGIGQQWGDVSRVHSIIVVVELRRIALWMRAQKRWLTWVVPMLAGTAITAAGPQAVAFSARRYCTASATWVTCTLAAPARSAIVRATFRQR